MSVRHPAPGRLKPRFTDFLHARGRATAALLGATIGAALTLTAAVGQEGAGSIEGSVVVADTGQPLAGVRISVPGVGGEVLTDAGGRFRLAAVPEGVRSLRAQREGYLPYMRMVPALSRPVDVIPGETTLLEPLPFVQAGSIAGQVLDARGAPSAGLSVDFLRRVYDDAGLPAWEPALFPTTTDAEGRYRSPDIAPGEYVVRVVGRTSEAVGSEVTLRPATYYPGTLNPALAAPVAVRGGAEAVASIRLESPGARRVSGSVVDPVSGAGTVPETRMSLVPYQPGGPRLDPRETASLILPEGSDGTFGIGGVSPGEYELLAWAVSGDPGERVWSVGRTLVEVGDGDLEELPVVIGTGVDVTGRLRVIGDANGFEISVPVGAVRGLLRGEDRTLVRISLRPRDNSPAPDFSRPAVDGLAFRFARVPPGLYTVNVTVSGTRDSAYVADVRSNGRSVLADGLRVGSGPVDLDIEIRTDGGTVAARLEEPGAHPVHLALVPEPPLRANPLRYHRSSSSDSSRGIRIQGVAPGAYRLYVFEDLWSSPGLFPVRDPRFLARWEADGVAVRVDAQAEVTLDVPLLH